MVPSKYAMLSQATVAFDYLNTNSTTHVFPFSALAELLDNARDANANSCRVFTSPYDDVCGYKLSFLDDGTGMSPGKCRSKGPMRLVRTADVFFSSIKWKRPMSCRSVRQSRGFSNRISSVNMAMVSRVARCVLDAVSSCLPSRIQY